MDAHTGVSSPKTEMAAESKLAVSDKVEIKRPSDDDSGIMSIAYSFIKKIATVGIIYFVGYMGWSVAWLIGNKIMVFLLLKIRYNYFTFQFKT